MYIQTRYSIYDIQYYFICIPLFPLSEEQQEFLSATFNQVIENQSSYVHEIKVSDNQVHIIFSMPISKTLKDMINVLKSHTSFLFRKQYPETKEFANLWLKGYFISTVGVKNEKAVGRILKKIKPVCQH